ncbi:MAG: hypothetical protein KDE27_15680 [Planctomycetes bacterium]|nr:hypothetical protein [Planctomycetota bacterium]
MKPVLTRSVLCSVLAGPALLASLFTNPPAAPVALPVPVPDLATAQLTTAVLTDALVAAVVSISDAAPPTATATELAAGFAAVSALLSPGQHTYRLIDASGDPIEGRNRARGAFEIDGLAQLLGGAASVQASVGNELRTLVPLTSDMHPNCATCHANYGALPAGTIVGAASLRVRL